MTNGNANQLVVKAQIEYDRTAMQDQQVATADQPTARQTAPDAPSTATDRSARVQSPAEIQTPAENPSTTAPGSPLTGNAPNTPDVVTIDTNGRGKPAHGDFDPGTSDTSASLSDLNRIAMGVQVVRTTRATGATVEGEQPSTSGVTATQAVSTQQDPLERLVGTNASGLDILDLDVEGSEDFSDINLDLADELLGGSPVEMIKNWVARCNQDVTSGLDQETQPDLERGFKSLELADEETPEVAVRTITSVIQVPAAPSPSVAATEDERRERPETIAAQPGLSIGRRTFWIDGVGEFRLEDGQPTALYAYPPVVTPTELMEGDPDQAYRGQDLVDPMVIRPRHTR